MPLSNPLVTDMMNMENINIKGSTSNGVTSSITNQHHLLVDLSEEQMKLSEAVNIPLSSRHAM